MFCRWDNRPIDDAKSYDHKEIVELLTKYMSNTSQSDEWTWTFNDVGTYTKWCELQIRTIVINYGMYVVFEKLRNLSWVWRVMWNIVMRIPHATK